MSDQVVLYTGMPASWNEQECLHTAKSVIQREMPWRDSISEIEVNPGNEDCFVVRMTIEVLPGTLAEHLADTQHKG